MTRIISSTSPQKPSDVVLESPATSAAQVAEAVVRARVAQKSWGENAIARAAALRGCAEGMRAHSAEMAALITREVGKASAEAKGEVARAIAILDYNAQAALDPIGTVIPPTTPGYLIAVRQAYGVAGLITPWNFPIAIPTWKAAPALAVGNAVVMKPSGMAIGVAKFMEEIFAEHLPKDIFQVLIGGAECGQAVIEFSDVISFTGSSEVGSQIVAQAAKLGKPVQAEMGGQNPAIVLPDADLALTAAHLSNASMAFAGQKCTATSRIIVVGDDARYKEVCEALVAGVEKMTPNDPATDGVLVGPVISESAREDVVNAAKGAIARGGKVLYGASPLDRDGWFYTPTLICDLDANDPLNQEETFGPIAGVIRAKTVGDAITSANTVRFGLTGSVHGRDLEATLRVAQKMQTGMVKINAPTAGLDFHAPVGGTKDSSYGEREQGKEGLAFYSFIRTVTIGSGTQKYE